MGVCVGDGPPVMLEGDLDDLVYRHALTRAEAEHVWTLVHLDRKRETAAVKATKKLRGQSPDPAPDHRVTRRQNLEQGA